jgi:glucosamine--fructose-6-phosphate aminotransferase (isomerizing)
VRGVPAAEINLFPQTQFSPGLKYLLIPISRSGKTVETLDAIKYVKKKLSAEVFLITCTAESEMSRISDRSFFCPAAAEETKFMTKSFTSMLLACQLFIAHNAGNKTYQSELKKLPQQGDRIIDVVQSTCEKLARENSFDRYFFLGHGPRYGIAAESMLKLTEMVCIPAVVYHGMELMHGPKYAVNNKSLTFYFLSDSAIKQEIDLLQKIRKFPGKIAVICEETTPEISDTADYIIALHSGLSEYSRLILIMLITQLYAYHRALATGREID